MLAIFVVAYLLLTIGIGVFARRCIRSSSDFVQAGRRLPMFMNASALFALWFGSETVFGASSEFLENGLIGVIEDPFGGVLCLLLFGLFFARKLYQLNILTIGDLFRDRYGKRVEIISSLFMLLTFFGYVAAQLVALSLVLKAITGMDTFYGIIICSAIVTLYTFIGGMWAVSITDFIQSIFIVVGLLILSFFLADKAGGVDMIISGAPDHYFNFFPEAEPISITNWIAAWLTLGLGSLASQDIFQRVNSARTERAAVRSTYLGAGLYLVFALFPLFIGLAVRVLYPDMDLTDTQEVIPRVVMMHAPFWVQVLFFGSLLSAILSTCSGALLAPASILSENIIKPLTKKEEDDASFLRIVRWSVVIIAIVSTGMALMRSDIYELVAESSILGIVSLLVPMVWALYRKEASARGATLSMFLGMGTWLFFEFLYPIEIASFLPALGIGIIAMILGDYFSKKMIDSKI